MFFSVYYVNFQIKQILWSYYKSILFWSDYINIIYNRNDKFKQ